MGLDEVREPPMLEEGDFFGSAPHFVEEGSEAPTSGAGDDFGGEFLPTFQASLAFEEEGGEVFKPLTLRRHEGARWAARGRFEKKEEWGESPGWQPVWSCGGPLHGGTVAKPVVEWVGFVKSPG